MAISGPVCICRIGAFLNNWFLTVFGEVTTLTFDIFTSKCKLFIWVANEAVNLVKSTQAVCKILRSQTFSIWSGSQLWIGRKWNDWQLITDEQAGNSLIVNNDTLRCKLHTHNQSDAVTASKCAFLWQQCCVLSSVVFARLQTGCSSKSAQLR